MTIVVVKEQTENGDFVLYVKGTPQEILKKCSTIEINGQIQNITDNLNIEFNIAV